MKTVREIVAIVTSFTIGSLFLTFLSYFQKNLIGISSPQFGYVVAILIGGCAGAAFYILLQHNAELAKHINLFTGTADTPLNKIPTSRVHLSFHLLIGGTTLCLFSIIQKSLAGYPLHLKGFVVPLLFGGFSGLLVGLLFLRNRRLLDQERQSALFWQQEKEKTIDILTSISDGLLVTDRHGCVELVNERAEEFLELSAATITGQTLATLISHATGDDFSTFFDQDNIGSTNQFNIMTRDGSLRTLKGTTSVAHNSGAIIMILRDNTAEQRIKRMKSEFTSMATHNLKTPITAITGYSELLLSEQLVTPDQQREFLTYINDKAWQLDKLINNLLDINRLESGRHISLVKEEMPASALFDSVRQYCNQQQTLCTLQLDLHDTACSLFIDRTKMEQVMENLISNAVKFSPDGGQICISSSQQGGRYETTISDEGIGMNEEVCQHMFDKFYRADASDSAKNGIGLGLTLAKELIEAHGGEISAISAPQQGTTITLTLPIRESDLHVH